MSWVYLTFAGILEIVWAVAIPSCSALAKRNSRWRRPPGGGGGDPLRRR